MIIRFDTGETEEFNIIRGIGDGCDEAVLDALIKMQNDISWILGRKKNDDTISLLLHATY